MSAMDARLAFRILRGSGRREWARLIAMTVGVALAVLAALIGTAAPLASSQQHTIEVDRAPELGDQTAGNALEVLPSTTTIGDRVWTRITVSGVGTASPKPPGVRSWPQPGETLVSPGLRRLVERSPDIVRMIGRLAPGAIGRAGLVSPDELYSYSVGAGADASASSPAKDAAPGRSTVVVGFGNDAGAPQSPTTMLIIEITVLVLVPAVMFLMTALRLSAVSRQRRSFVLGLAGMSPARAARLYAWEMSLVTAVGVLGAVLTFLAIEPWLGGSGILGVRWWPGDGSMRWWGLAIVGVSSVIIVRILARKTMRASAARARSEQARPPARWQGWVAVAVGVPALCALAAACVYGATHSTDAWASDSHAAKIAVAVVAALFAVVMGVSRFVVVLADRIAPTLPPAYALGVRGAGYRVSSTRRLVAFVAGSVVLAGLSAAFLQALHTSAFGDPGRARISVGVADLARSAQWTSKLPDYPYTVDATLPGPGGQYSVTVGDCQAVERQAAEVFLHPGPCTDRIQRSSGGIGGATVLAVAVGNTTVAVPPSPAVDGFTWDLKFPLRDATWLGTLKQGQLTFWVSKSDASFKSTMAELLSRFPQVPVDAGLKDPVRYASYLHQVGTVRAATALGVLLSVWSFILTALEGRWQRSRSVAVLAALGANARALRRANALEFLFPLIVAVIPAAAVSVLGGWAVLSFWGTSGMFAPVVPLWAGGSSAIVLVVAVATGWLTGWSQFRRERLADA